MEISFRLDPSDIREFREGLDRARKLVRTMDECDVVDSAKASLETLPIGEAPGYVRRQLARVQTLIVMLEDEEFALPQAARREVLAALVYLGDPDDLIPDARPVVGLLDDAIMVELVMRELGPTIGAFDAFVAERRAVRERLAGDRLGIARHLAATRARLHATLLPSGDRVD
jgi:uncharacterized membrane protein YkvA (DUF1232 family)